MDRIFTTAAVHYASISQNYKRSTSSTTMTRVAIIRIRPCRQARQAFRRYPWMEEPPHSEAMDQQVSVVVKDLQCRNRRSQKLFLGVQTAVICPSVSKILIMVQKYIFTCSANSYLAWPPSADMYECGAIMHYSNTNI